MGFKGSWVRIPPSRPLILNGLALGVRRTERKENERSRERTKGAPVGHPAAALPPPSRLGRRSDPVHLHPRRAHPLPRAVRRHWRLHHEGEQERGRRRADGPPSEPSDRRRRPRPIHADTDGPVRGGVSEPDDQHPPRLPSRLPRPPPIPPSRGGGGKNERTHEPLRDRDAGWRAHHRTGRLACYSPPLGA